MGAEILEEVTCKLKPDNGNYLNTLGVAQYRVGYYEEALATLTESDELNGGIPADLAFIAMAHQQLGHFEEAKEVLERLRAMMPSSFDAQAFLREAEARIDGE